MKALSILLSALFTGVVAQCLGLLLFHWLRPRLAREEQYLYGFVAGSALLSLLVFAATACGMAWTGTFAAIGIVAIGACVYRRAYRPFETRLDPVPLFYQFALAAVMLVYGAWYLANAWAPEASADGSMYHLGLVQRFLDQKGFGRITTSMYASMPLGLEMLFLFAFSLGRHSAAALVHFFFLLALPLILLAAGRRLGYTRAGATAAILIFASPIFGYDGSSAYVDVAMACVIFCIFALLQIWDKTREATLLPVIGLLAGFAYAIKMTAFLAIPYAIGFVLYKTLRRREPFWKPVLVLGGCAALMVAPWLVKSAITVGNPFAPFLNEIFPNPYMRIRMEQTYREYLRTYSGLKSWWDVPLEVTMRGGLLNGLLGPTFLLAPLALVALRWKLGRQLVFAALVFAAAYPTNVGTRFLMGAAPFVAFAIAMTLTHWRGMAPLVILFHVVVCWPRVIDIYQTPYAWKLENFHWRGALRLQPESDYLNARITEYARARMAESLVPKNGRIFTYGGLAQAYCRREIITSYESSFGNMLGDSMMAAILPTYQPTRWWTYRFPKQSVRKVRFVQKLKSDTEVWSISEIRLMGPQGEIPHGSGWRLRAHPNPWELQLAMDNCPATRWTAAEPSKPGMFYEIEFDKPVELVAIRLESTLDQPDGTARLETENGGGWKTLVETPAILDGPPLDGMRQMATDDLKRNGITHISVSDDEYFAADMAEDPEAWGVTLLGEVNSNRIYKIN